MEYDGQLLRAFPWIAVAAHVYLAHRQFAEVRFLLPSLPLVIAPAFKWMLWCVLTLAAPCYSGVQCVTGAQTDKRLLTPELTLRFGYQSQQRTLVATVRLLRV